MIRINLLPVKAAQKKEMLRGQLVVLALSVTLVLVGCVGVYSSLLNKIGDEREEISRKENEISSLRKAIGEVGRFKKLQNELQGKLDVLDKLKEGQTGPVHLLDELSKSLPEKLWISSFKESGGNVSLQGVGLNEATVAQFLRNLEGSPYYQGVELQVIEQTSAGGRKLQRFDVTCRVEVPVKNVNQ
jgi:type IV pilus assembly protein PilN